MDTKKKLVVIGAGSSYSPELFEGLIDNRDKLPLKELVLVDIPEGEYKMNTIFELGKRMFEAANYELEISKTYDRRAALQGADFVITQIRVGQMKAREKDELIPLKYDFLGQETVGVGGMMKGLRTIPVLQAIGEEMTELCPDAWLINFTNPSGMVSEAVYRYTKHKKVIGLCNSPIGTSLYLSEFFDVPEEDIQAEYVGLNHCHWLTGVKVQGQERLPELLQDEYGYSAANVEASEWNLSLVQNLKAVPNYYLHYYYDRRETLAQAHEDAETQGSRAQQVEEIEKSLFKKYEQPSLTTKPKELEQRGGAHYSTAAVRLMVSLNTGDGRIQTINVPNEGMIPFLPDDAFIEINCKVTEQGPEKIRPEHLPEGIKGLIFNVKNYERLTMQVAQKPTPEAALVAFSQHPLCFSVDQAEPMIRELFEAHQDYLDWSATSEV